MSRIAATFTFVIAEGYSPNVRKRPRARDRGDALWCASLAWNTVYSVAGNCERASNWNVRNRCGKVENSRTRRSWFIRTAPCSSWIKFTWQRPGIRPSKLNILFNLFIRAGNAFHFSDTVPPKIRLFFSLIYTRRLTWRNEFIFNLMKFMKWHTTCTRMRTRTQNEENCALYFQCY